MTDQGMRTPLLDRPLDSVNGTGHVTHYAHPRSLDKTWCGAEREPVPYVWNHNGPSCVVCRDLYQELGRIGWMMDSAGF